MLSTKIHIPASVQMGYMTVEEHSITLLHLKRSPGIRSWSLLVGKCVCADVRSSFKYEMDIPN